MSWWDDLLSLFDSGGGDAAATATDAATTASDATGALSTLSDSPMGDVGDLVSGLGEGLASAVTDNAPDYSSVSGVTPDYASYAQRQGFGGLATDGVAEPAGALTKIGQGLGIVGRDGNIDYADPKVMDRILKSVMVGGNVLNALAGGNKPKGYKTPAQLKSELAGPFNNWSPDQAATAQRYFNNPVTGPRPLKTPTAPRSFVATPRYAAGGPVDSVDDSNPSYHSPGALQALVTGPGGGQDDLVPARLGRGEYVFDADVVASLGDGSNERGAEILDKWRAELRAHKRAAPAHKIPPRAKAPASYLRKVKGA